MPEELLPLLVVFAFVFCIFTTSISIAHATVYNPGQTLSPDCGPTDLNCGVRTSIFTTDTQVTGGILFATSSTAWSILSAGSNGQVLKLSGGVPIWGTDAGGTSYTAGSGLALSGTAFALDLANANTWSGIQTLSSGLTLGGNTYTNLVGTGLSFAGGILSSSLGTEIDSSEITDSTITTSDIADDAVTFAKFASNSCAANEIPKWNGSAWACGADNSNAYTAGTGLSLASNVFALDINGLTAVSSVTATDTIPVHTANGVRRITRSDLFSDVLGALNYRGSWNAGLNSPSLASGVGTKGYYYVVSTAGSTNLDGITSWAVNDWAVFNGTVWEKVQTTNAITSVFGRTGAVVASGGDYSASQITNTASGNISAVTVQNALSELDSEKQSTALNSGLVWIGNASNQAAAVSLTGDITVSNTGTTTIEPNAVALGTDTTGNYIATLADSGAGLFTIANSGVESAAATIALVDNALDLHKLKNALTLDASKTITFGGSNLTFAITGGGLPKYTRTTAGQWMHFADDTDTFGMYNRAGTPEGSIAADKGSLAIDTTNGALYIKTTDTLDTGWSAFGLSGAGITSLNGLTGGTQTFAIGTSGTDVSISSSGTTHTFNIPDASATARGLVSTSTQTIAGAKTFSSAITAPTSANTINGLIINSGALSGITGITVPSFSTAGVVHNNSSGAFSSSLVVNADVDSAAAIALSKLASGSNIVTSIAAPSGSNANGGSISSNVLTLSLADGTNPGLVGAGTQTFAGGKTFNGALTLATHTGGILQTNGSGVVSTTSVSSLGGFVNNGNAFGALATLGTTDENSLRFIASSAEAMRILASGNVGIGVTAPQSKLSINGLNGANVLGVYYDVDNFSIRSVMNHGGNTGGINSAGGLQIAAQGGNNSTLGSGDINFFVTGSNSAGPHTDASYTAAMKIRYDGNVGIGTVSPSSVLQVVTSASSGLTLGGTTNNTTSYATLGRHAI